MVHSGGLLMERMPSSLCAMYCALAAKARSPALIDSPTPIQAACLKKDSSTQMAATIIYWRPWDPPYWLAHQRTGEIFLLIAAARDRQTRAHGTHEGDQ